MKIIIAPYKWPAFALTVKISSSAADFAMGLRKPSRGRGRHQDIGGSVSEPEMAGAGFLLPAGLCHSGVGYH
ncbi:hypothetical protein ABID08_002329 [Rhizobium binae]|uniref:Uncharacterized protein n=1 Tax=Rhizobium binae TaxID=1138190 RepID=A0ABV2MET6_9HYPH|nr:hypothetical protein [Rhizobium binae]MBX4927326.1 hypothetical protein [Rhizobium binae]MBX4993146.1 hypothetical protein [Rhizobium binae]NKL47449.1 hypothetical protein [Rhizobium leguminosarum bv. viciae]QSY83932.1 hypothetical protein J2J99_09120 [Rhizobium binae]